MRRASRLLGRWGVWLGIGLAIACRAALAEVTTEDSTSILIFPKVLFDSRGLQTGGTPVDTIIQISNTANQLVFAHCFYVNAVPPDPTRPPNPINNIPAWQEVDFDILLTKQQPTHWVVSQGRRNDLNDPTCTMTPPNNDCNGAGLDPGNGSFVPVTPDPFTGELKCIEVDATGAPLSGNHLKGEATIISKNTGDASKYNAVGIIGVADTNDSDSTLCIGGGVTDQCPSGAEYDGCPQTVMLDHFAANASDPVIDELGQGPSTVSTELTLVPCTEDFENQAPTSLTVQFQIINEFETIFSASTTVDCWLNFRLDRFIPKVFDINALGTRFVQTRITAGSADQGNGFVGVVEEFHAQPGTSSRVAFNLHGQGERANGDVIVMPEFQ